MSQVLADHSHAGEGQLAGPRDEGMLPKPKLNSPCNHCGMCCTVQPCELANEFLNCTEGPCIALERDGIKQVCGLVRRPAYYMFGEHRPESETGHLSVLFANSLGIGRGCDADDVDPSVWQPVIFVGSGSVVDTLNAPENPVV